DDTVTADALGHFETAGTKLTRHARRGFLFHERKLGIAMQLAIERLEGCELSLDRGLNRGKLRAGERGSGAEHQKGDATGDMPPAGRRGRRFHGWARILHATAVQ